MCADALAVRLEPKGDPLSALALRLRRRALLICLDTCEHVLDAAAEVVSRLLEMVPGLRVIATSREPLAVDGEAVWRVPSLVEDEAARLFVERAELVGAQMSAGDDPTVRAICRRVDCLALAVELAAAWTRVMSAPRLLAGLADRFQLLSGGPRRAVPRHQALRASMDWSHHLLTGQEQVVFRRLAVFAGWFDEAAADAVCGFAPVPDPGVMPVLMRLVDQSLVVAQPLDGEVRYRASGHGAPVRRGTSARGRRDGGGPRPASGVVPGGGTRRRGGHAERSGGLAGPSRSGHRQRHLGDRVGASAGRRPGASERAIWPWR